MRGSFGIGVWHPKTKHNIGTLWRSAYQLGASFIFTIGARYKRQASDTYNTPGNIPLLHFDDLDELVIPYGHPLIGVEFNGESVPLPEVEHPRQALYLLGAEDHGLLPHIAARCHRVIEIPHASTRPASYNVAVAGALVMYDRLVKRSKT